MNTAIHTTVLMLNLLIENPPTSPETHTNERLRHMADAYRTVDLGEEERSVERKCVWMFQ